MAARWQIQMLGGFALIGSDRTQTHFRTHKAVALLTFLAYYRGRAFPREVLVDMLWPEVGETAGRHSLSTELWSLRDYLEPPPIAPGEVLVADRFAVTLREEAVATDVGEFKAALQQAERAASDGAKIQALRRAVDLYQGELLPGFYEEWVVMEQPLLSETFVTALEDLVSLLEQRGDPTAAIKCALKAIQVDYLREEPYRELMRLYSGIGEPTAALKLYGDLERTFRQELGAMPSPATQALAHTIELARAGSRPRLTESRWASLPAHA